MSGARGKSKFSRPGPRLPWRLLRLTGDLAAAFELLSDQRVQQQLADVVEQHRDDRQRELALEVRLEQEQRHRQRLLTGAEGDGDLPRSVKAEEPAAPQA